MLLLLPLAEIYGKPAPEVDNLIRNPSCEQAGLAHFEDMIASGRGEVTIDAEHAQHGNRSLKITGVGADARVSQAIKVQQNTVNSLRMLGHNDVLSWTQDSRGLHVSLPAGRPCEHAWALKIDFQ